MYGYGYSNFPLEHSDGWSQSPAPSLFPDPPDETNNECPNWTWAWASAAANVGLGGLVLYMVCNWPRTAPPTAPKTRTLWENTNPLYNED